MHGPQSLTQSSIAFSSPSASINSAIGRIEGHRRLDRNLPTRYQLRKTWKKRSMITEPMRMFLRTTISEPKRVFLRTTISEPKRVSLRTIILEPKKTSLLRKTSTTLSLKKPLITNIKKLSRNFLNKEQDTTEDYVIY